MSGRLLLLAGRRALVTGGSRGIGLAIARRLADEGCAVTLAGGRDAEHLRAAVAGLPKQQRWTVVLRREEEGQEEDDGVSANGSSTRAAQGKEEEDDAAATGDGDRAAAGAAAGQGAGGGNAAVGARQSPPPSPSPWSSTPPFPRAAAAAAIDSAAAARTSAGPAEAHQAAGSETPHDYLPGNVGAPDFWRELQRRNEPYDIFVNAAGVGQRGLLLRTPADEVEDVLRTNLLATTWACQAASSIMARRRSGGCIINIASLLAFKGGRGASVYAASKAGVVGLTRALASEVGRLGIRVNCILPGYIDTAMLDDMDEAEKAALKSKIPLGRFGTADEVADAALFLVTNQYASNCVLNLDGGLSAV